MTRSSTRPIISLLTDFGLKDAYVASMKGVILGLNPEAVLVDLTHEVPPRDIRAGAFVLATAIPYFPTGTIHLAVVDPGVGSPRRALAAHARGQLFVGPDNGLFTPVFRGAPDLAIVSLENDSFFRPQVSPTFHGRDLFAPVAAHLSLGVKLGRFGPLITNPVVLTWPSPVFTGDSVLVEVLSVDHFGNLVTNLEGEALHAWLGGGKILIQAGPLAISHLSLTYTDGAPGDFLALVGSHGYLEIACNGDRAVARLEAGVGLRLKIRKL